MRVVLQAPCRGGNFGPRSTVQVADDQRLSELRQDVRYGLRTLATSPGFTFVAIASLSLGIAVATCAYSEVNGLILRDIPGVRRAGELVALQEPSSYPNYVRYRERNDLFSQTTAYVAPVPFDVSFTPTLGSRADRIWGQLVTVSYFATLGVQPARGRFPESANVPEAVLSYRLWEQRFGGAPAIMGKQIRVNGSSMTVAGVGPRGFLGASPGYFPADLWISLEAAERIAPELRGNALERRDPPMFQVTARLQPGVPMERAEAALDATARQMERDYGDANRDRGGRRVQLVPGGKVLPIRRQDRPFFTETLLVLGVLMLSIACSNVANMMLARSRARWREMAVRISLGANRSRLIRQLLTESMLIAAGAGAVGVAVSWWLMRLAAQIRLPGPAPVSFDLAPDWRVFLFALAATAAAGLGFGFLPALQATRAGLAPALKEGGEMQLGRHRAFNLRNGLMLCQMTGSLTLLLLTAFLGLGIQTTAGVQQGFDASNLYLVALDPVRDGYPAAQAASLFDKLLARVRQLPSIQSAAITETVPASLEGNSGATFSEAGVGSTRNPRGARRHIVGEGYFETAGIPILQGRPFREGDKDVVIVSQTLANSFSSGQGMIGQSIIGRPIAIASTPPRGGFGAIAGASDFRQGALSPEFRDFEVIGVAGDVSEDLIASRKHPAIYFPLRAADYAQPSPNGVTLMLRSKPGVDAIGAAERELAAIDPSVTPFHARSMAEQIAEFMQSLRSAAWTWNLLGAFGMILAASGLAGVTAYGVMRRRREIGIRVALGAQRRDVLSLVMKEGAAVIAAGTLIGMILTWAGVKAMSAFFFSVASVKSFEPAVLVGAPVLLAGLALAACYAAGRKALAIEPAIALRRQ